ncbi:BRO family protein [Delftia lacustris]|uniref:BRO family protein n=1 Tax=Delftia lacustris TaxID=558537 RepID=UPI001F1508C5|nr:BRO family protein [Delftia lacustris]
MFQDHSIRLIEKDGKKWASAADIAMALGYSRADSVTRLYDKHRAEFSDSMTCIVETTETVFSGALVAKSRVFSLRGAHLIGMLARTNKAQEFRRWVLDILEGHRAAPSLIQAWYEARAALDAQEKFASLCGRGLSEHKTKRPPLQKEADALMSRIQPSLQFQ